MQEINLLTIITFLPLAGAFFILLALSINKENSESNSKYIALWTSLTTFLISLLLIYGFNSSVTDFQFYERIEIAGGIMTYQMGIDGISILFVILTTFLTPIIIISSWDSIKYRIEQYMIAFLVLETLMIGTFSALDIILFYLFLIDIYIYQ